MSLEKSKKKFKGDKFLEALMEFDIEQKIEEEYSAEDLLMLAGIHPDSFSDNPVISKMLTARSIQIMLKGLNYVSGSLAESNNLLSTIKPLDREQEIAIKTLIKANESANSFVKHSINLNYHKTETYHKKISAAVKEKSLSEDDIISYLKNNNNLTDTEIDNINILIDKIKEIKDNCIKINFNQTKLYCDPEKNICSTENINSINNISQIKKDK